ncbi:MAG: hypothetical protein ACI845_003906 [Gammaproteobacteria bacterium]|jgi:hypothetical protein
MHIHELIKGALAKYKLEWRIFSQGLNRSRGSECHL